MANRQGRKRKPRGLKLIEGGKPETTKKAKVAKPPRARVQLEASVPIVVDKVPPGLPKAGAQFWKKLAPELRRLGLLGMKDMPTFYLACLAWGLACNASNILAREGYTVGGTHGTEKKHPALTMLNEQMTQYRQYMSEFGLSPVAAERIKLVLEDADDDMQGYLNAKA